MNVYYHNDFRIEVFDWGGIPYADELRNGQHGFRKQIMEDPEYVPAAIYGIRIFRGTEEVNSCIISNTGVITRVEEHSVKMDGDRLLLCCCGLLFCLSIPDLDVVWKAQADPYQCFEVYKMGSDFITYGSELISRIDAAGSIIWQFKGADYFVSMYLDGGFTIESDHIYVRDVNDRQYRIGFDGKQATG